MSGVVYILTNPVMPGLIKIGQTGSEDSLPTRIANLSGHSGVPVPFDVHYACRVENAEEMEKRLHKFLSEHRINKNREFFRISPERVRELLSLVEIEEVVLGKDIVQDESEQESLDSERKRRSVFRFCDFGIKPGSTLTFTRDPKIKAEVLDDRNIKYEGRTTSLSQAANDALEKTYGAKRAQVNGTLYWRYNGQTLSDLREGAEGESD